MSPRTPLAALLVALLAGAAPASADEPDAATRAATTLSAVQLAEEAGDLFQAGKFAEALERYQRADALVRRHTIGVRIARCLTHLGRLNEAAARYDAVTRMPLPTDLEPEKLAKQKEALGQAESERDALLPRIPAVVVQIVGAPDAVVTLDGQPLPAALIGVKRETDPGAHHLEARAGAEVVTRDFVLEERQVLTVPLELHPAAAPPPAPPPPVPDTTPPPPKPPEPPPVPPPAPVHGGLRRTLGFVGIGVGAAGITAGIVTGSMALGKKGALQEPSECGHDLMCPHMLASQASTYNTLRGASSAGFIAGGVVAAAGIVLVVTAPAPASKAATGYTIFASPGVVGLRGAF